MKAISQPLLRDSDKRLTSGLVMTLTPPAIAARQSPDVSALQAWYIATIEEEQAVSIVMDGPLNSKT